MVDIVALLQCPRPSLTATMVRQFSRLRVALGAMTGRGTRRGIARWAGPGGSSRTLQRLFAPLLP
jgi:putative transposase